MPTAGAAAEANRPERPEPPNQRRDAEALPGSGPRDATPSGAAGRAMPARRAEAAADAPAPHRPATDPPTLAGRPAPMHPPGPNPPASGPRRGRASGPGAGGPGRPARVRQCARPPGLRPTDGARSPGRRWPAPRSPRRPGPDGSEPARAGRPRSARYHDPLRTDPTRGPVDGSRGGSPRPPGPPRRYRPPVPVARAPVLPAPMAVPHRPAGRIGPPAAAPGVPTTPVPPAVDRLRPAVRSSAGSCASSAGCGWPPWPWPACWCCGAAALLRDPNRHPRSGLDLAGRVERAVLGRQQAGRRRSGSRWCLIDCRLRERNASPARRRTRPRRSTSRPLTTPAGSGGTASARRRRSTATTPAGSATNYPGPLGAEADCLNAAGVAPPTRRSRRHVLRIAGSVKVRNAIDDDRTRPQPSTDPPLTGAAARSRRWPDDPLWKPTPAPS